MEVKMFSGMHTLTFSELMTMAVPLAVAVLAVGESLRAAWPRLSGERMLLVSVVVGQVLAVGGAALGLIPAPDVATAVAVGLVATFLANGGYGWLKVARERLSGAFGGTNDGATGENKESEKGEASEKSEKSEKSETSE
jgi:hypothetical protein